MSSPPTSWKYGDPPVGPQTPDDFAPKHPIPFSMPEPATLHVHVHHDAEPWRNEPRKGKGPGGGEWTSGGGSPGGGAGAALKAGPTAQQTKQSQHPSGVAGPAPEDRPSAVPTSGGAHQGPPPHVAGKLPMGAKSAAPPYHEAEHVGGELFSPAAQWRQDYDPKVTEPDVYKAMNLSTERLAEMHDIYEKGQALPETRTLHRDPKTGRYDLMRQALHDDIIHKGAWGVDEDDYSKMKWYPPLLGEEQITKALPPPGQKPTFVMLAGRGGSGKTKLKGRVYDEAHTLVLDADRIKHMLPEFKGWNAGQVHEESSDILDRALEGAREHGLNVVLDATLKSLPNAQAKMDAFEKAGYCTEGHEMYLPAFKASQRSVGRYFSPGEKAGADPKARGRFVTPAIILANVNNEKNFEALRPRWKAWSFWSNDVPMGQEPKLMARGGSPCM